jgi:hypothetical protein
MEANQEQQPNALKERILDKIESGDVAMHSDAYFALKTAGLIAAAIGVLVITIFICNFIFFSMRINHHIQLLTSGATGWSVLLRIFPWWLLLFDVALMVYLQQMLKGFRFGYQIPVAYIFLILIALAIAVSLLLDDGIDVNDRLLEHAHRHELPPGLNQLYEGAPHPMPSARIIRVNIQN